jgi:hypothetical protein
MWDHHWSRGAAQRVDALAPTMDRWLRGMRAAGCHIVFCPSDVTGAYEGTGARRRCQEAPRWELSSAPALELPPHPVGVTDGGSDTRGDQPVHTQAWRAQHPALFIDDDRDGLSDVAEEVFGYLAAREVGLVLMAGVHLNMCVLKRPFALIELVRNGFEAALVQDLTDAMYDPADSPYVSHEEGNRLMRGYVARFLCPVVSSDEVRIEACSSTTMPRPGVCGSTSSPSTSSIGSKKSSCQAWRRA